MTIIPKTVLLLKSQVSEDGQDKYESILKSNNFEVMQIKTLVFNYKNIDNLHEKLKDSHNYQGIILSSPRCVTAVQLALSDNLSQEWKIKSNFVVGEATYNAAFEKLGLDCQGRDTGNAMNLSKLIVESKSSYSKPFLFPHGNLKTDTLNLELGKEGLQIEGLEVYDTTANPNIEQDFVQITNKFQLAPEYAVFFSPSGFSSCVGFLQRISTDMKQIKFVAIGPVTEMAITERGLPVYAVSKRPTPEDVLSAILS